MVVGAKNRTSNCTSGGDTWLRQMKKNGIYQ